MAAGRPHHLSSLPPDKWRAALEWRRADKTGEPRECAQAGGASCASTKQSNSQLAQHNRRLLGRRRRRTRPRQIHAGFRTNKHNKPSTTKTKTTTFALSAPCSSLSVAVAGQCAPTTRAVPLPTISTLARMSHCGKFQFEGDLLRGKWPRRATQSAGPNRVARPHFDCLRARADLRAMCKPRARAHKTMIASGAKLSPAAKSIATRDACEARRNGQWGAHKAPPERARLSLSTRIAQPYEEPLYLTSRRSSKAAATGLWRLVVVVAELAINAGADRKYLAISRCPVCTQTQPD